MDKRVVVIASGETERRSLRYLLAHLKSEGITISEIRRPDGNKALTVEMSEKLVKAAWYAPSDNVSPDKFVILVDSDGHDPEAVLQPFRSSLPNRLGANVNASLQFACAVWHLEAWYFADAVGLRKYLDRDLGNVDSSNPDLVENPKLCLKHLLGDRAYTVVVSEAIAQSLDPGIIERHSPSFKDLLNAIRNGQRC